MRRAIIDIGTNTAHVMIADVVNARIEKKISAMRFYTFLGDDGLEQINTQAQERLFEALDKFYTEISRLQCAEVHVLATDALRSSSNGPQIQNKIHTKYGWPITIISGDIEADLIYHGVHQIFDLQRESHLIMDIGGGSVEFILTNENQRIFQESYPIGISRLYGQFHGDRAGDQKDIDNINKYLDSILQPLWQFIQEQELNPILIGCAGTFEIFLSDREKADKEINVVRIAKDKLVDRLNMVIDKDIEKRSLVPGIPKERAKYILVALVLIKYVIDVLHTDWFYVSKYALKEGGIVQDKYY